MLGASHRWSEFASPTNLTNAITLVASSPNRSYDRITLPLFRALLRECTYLPDPAARINIRSDIVSNLRRRCPRQQPGTVPRDLKKALLDRIPTLLRDGVRNLRLLIRANRGHPDELYKVLATTYGRRGKRKHELLETLRAKDGPVMPENLNLASSSDETKMNVPRIGKAVTALITSQKAQREFGFDKGPIKHLKPMIDKENIWGRPLPLRRAVNKNKEWYAKTLAAILPPLSERDWNRLGDLANGRIQWQGPVPRRTQAVVQSVAGEDDSQFFQGFPDEAEDMLDDPMSNDLCSKGLGNVKTNPHTLSPRYMRGLWAKVFVRCPVLSWVSEKQKWVVRWGSVREEKEIVLALGQHESIDLFD